MSSLLILVSVTYRNPPPSPAPPNSICISCSQQHVLCVLEVALQIPTRFAAAASLQILSRPNTSTSPYPLESRHDRTLMCCFQVSARYCLACEIAICEDCMKGEHSEHPTDSLENIVDQQLAALQDRVDSAKNR